MNPWQSEYVEFKGAYYKAEMYLNFYALLYISCRCLYVCIPVTVKYYFLSSKIDTQGICCLFILWFQSFLPHCGMILGTCIPI